MNKKLLSLACAGAFAFSMSAGMGEPGLTEEWATPSIEALSGSWKMGNPPTGWNWANPAEIGKTPNTRFATAKDGKVYTVNQQTMAISEVTKEGLKDLFVLPQIGPDDFYGTAIAIDEAGNFLVGEDFLTRNSAIKWTVCTKNGQCKRFNLGDPDWTLGGRQDCVGRVLGDLTKEAIFFIAPANTGTSKVRVVKVTGDGSISSVKMETLAGVDVAPAGSNGQNIAQPGFNTYDEYLEAGADNYNFYYSAGNGYTAYINGKTYVNYEDKTEFAPDLLLSIKTTLNGFDTFTLGGKRYYVRSFAEKEGSSYPATLQFAVLDENGDRLTSWKSDVYSPYGGYMSLIAEPIDEESAYIYAYVSGNSAGAAARLLFKPADCSAPIAPEKPVGTTPETAYQITTPAELVAVNSLATSGDLYIALANDIDMSGVSFTGINVAVPVHFDGKNHVIKNLYTYDAKWDNWGLFKKINGGEVKNLGLEGSTHITSGGVVGAIAGETAGEVTIDNCYAISSGIGGAAGGLVGVTTGSLTVTNSYAIANLSGSAAAYLGGLVGRVGSYNQAATGTVTINNCYAAGTITTALHAGGIVAANTVGAKIILDNVIALNTSISATNANAYYSGLSEDATITNAYTAEGLLLNGVAQEGKTLAELLAITTEWGTFNPKFNNGQIVLAWQPANGNAEKLGSKTNPHILATADDLANIKSKFTVGDNYFVVTDDIDMDGVAYVNPLGNANFSGVHTFIEGGNHVIKNLSITSGDYPSLIGVFMGEIRNLGLENYYVEGGMAAGFGCYLGHTSYEGTTVLENCFVEGIVNGTSSYAGGLGGYNNGKAVVKNCYALIDVTGKNYAGGVYGWVPGGETTIENVYVAGAIEATAVDAETGEMTGYAGGIINLLENWDGSKGTASIDNVAVFAESIVGGGKFTRTIEVEVEGQDEKETVEVEEVRTSAVNGGNVALASATNVYVTSDVVLTVGGDDVEVEGAIGYEDVLEIVKGWDAYSATAVNYYDLPVLKWQNGETNGINTVIAEEGEANGPAVYYNLQGVQVANPENGLYIVRRGNKVTKELLSK